MAYYRIYFLDAGDRIFGVKDAESESDQSAIEVGRPLLSRWPAVEEVGMRQASRAATAETCESSALRRLVTLPVAQ
jgi:hypothetical protein